MNHARARSGVGDAARSTARGLGELLITAGLVLLLFVAYQLVWTNLEARRAQDRVAEQIRDAWERPVRDPGGGTAAKGPRAADFGAGFAFLRIPRLGTGYSVPVVEGVGLDELARGVGHYPSTVRPGQVGNFAVAGHRATNGEPFAYLDRLRPGDVVVAETRRSWFTYVVDRSRIVAPTATWVIDPVPGNPAAAPTERLLTLTTCNPRWGSTERLIVFGHLEERRPKSEGPPPVLVRRA
ncbi:MAG: class E sortase [Actinomycetes bacterium]